MIEQETYKITEIFDVKNTKCILSRDIVENSGNTPYLTASQSNNAVGAYIDYDANLLDKGNCIFIGGKTFVVTYQENDFFSNDSHNLVLYLKNKEKKTRENQLYMATVIYKSLCNKYSWGDSISQKKIQADTVSLPKNRNGDPNYDYMTARIREMEASRIREMDTYLELVGLTNYELNAEEKQFLEKYHREEMKCKPFKLVDLFEWQPQREVRPLDIGKYEVNGKKAYPFYGQATLNNGIISYLCLIDRVLNNSLGKPTLLIHSNNQNIVYVETPFYLKDGHGATSVLQADFLNRETALYCIACIKKVIANIFSYNEKATKIALKNTTIQLPVGNDGNPDYDYMAAFIRIQQKFAAKNLMNWKERQLQS